MKTHRMLIITSVVLVTLLITTGVALAHAGAVYNTAEGDFSTVSGGRNNNISDPDSPVTTQEDNKFTQGVRIPNIPSGTQASRAVTRDLAATAGQQPLVTADAGPDQTVPGPSPVEVQFDGSGSTGDIISYRWINQFGGVRAEEVSPTFEVDFGQDPQPGATRTFTLEVADAEGNTDTDTVTITLAAPDSEPPPPPPQGEFPLDLVVFNDTQARFFLNNPQWVHAGDTFMIVSANAFSGDNENYDVRFVNNTAAALLNRFPETEVLATTSGRRNTRTAINNVDRSLIDIVMTVWEPRNPDFPTAAFDNNNSDTVNSVTRNFAREMTNLAHNRGLEYWMKPTGRSTRDRGKAGVLSYQDIIRITDGMNVQTQGSCVQNTFPRAVDGLINDYRATGSLNKDLFVQISLSGSGPNEVTPARAFQCAQVGWSRDPVDAVTMWWASSVPEDARDFLRRREDLLGQN
jgi:hypothetical protein